MPIRPAGPADLDEVRALFREYQEMLGVDLCFQGFAAELAALPGAYAPPRGRLLLADEDGAVGGVVALRPLDEEGACEMKRMFVRPSLRGRGLGRALAVAIIAEARAAGYRRVRLDTLRRLGAALALYRELGFVETLAYRANPEEDVVYMALEL
jgi:putative acetyltransferase